MEENPRYEIGFYNSTFVVEEWKDDVLHCQGIDAIPNGIVVVKHKIDIVFRPFKNVDVKYIDLFHSLKQSTSYSKIGNHLFVNFRR